MQKVLVRLVLPVGLALASPRAGAQASASCPPLAVCNAPVLASQATSAVTSLVTPFKPILSPGLQICGTAAIRPSPGKFPTCTPTFSPQELGSVQAVWLSAEGAIASTNPKAAAITAGGSSLVFRRADSTGAPPACSTIGQSEPCFTYPNGLATANTCYFPSAPASRRGQEVGSNLASEVAAIRQAAAQQRPGGPPPTVILAYRFDLVYWTEMEIAGFDPSWLASSGTSWTQFQNWIGNDTTDACTTTNADCAGPGIGKNGAKVECCVGKNPNAWNSCSGKCSWSWSDRGWSPPWDGTDLGLRLNDDVRVLGGNFQAVTYYMTRPGGQVFYPDAAVARQDNPAYQDWKVAAVKRLVVESGADMIHLNTKFFQYNPAVHGGSFYIGDNYPNVTTMTSVGGGGFSGNQAASGYRLAQYVAGWRALATKLHQQGVKYQVWMDGAVWGSTTTWDDPTTPSINENTIIRSVVYDADLVFVEQTGAWQNMVAELQARKVPYILLQDNCTNP